MNNESKIIQIEIAPYPSKQGYLIIGLDDNGAVWWFDNERDIWQREARPLAVQERTI